MRKIPDDPRFRHVTMFHTDLRRTFARVRAEQKAELAAKPKAVVRPIKGVKS
jgi:hypothetical protein